MSKGNPYFKVRIAPDLLARIQMQIQQRNMVTKNEPWTMSDFVRKAIEEKLAHMERARKPRGHSKRLAK